MMMVFAGMCEIKLERYFLSSAAQCHKRLFMFTFCTQIKNIFYAAVLHCDMNLHKFKCSTFLNLPLVRFIGQKLNKSFVLENQFPFYCIILVVCVCCKSNLQNNVAVQIFSAYNVVILGVKLQPLIQGHLVIPTDTNQQG